MSYNKLYFRFTKKDYPYDEDVTFESWGRIELIYHHRDSFIKILDWEWDILEIKEWFEENRSVLNTRQLNVLNEENRSIANLRDLAYGREFFFSEEEQELYYDKLNECFLPFFFHLRGTPTPNFYIGLNDKKGEISYYDEKEREYKRYYFDMKDFIMSTAVALDHIF